MTSLSDQIHLYVQSQVAHPPASQDEHLFVDQVLDIIQNLCDNHTVDSTETESALQPTKDALKYFASEFPSFPNASTLLNFDDIQSEEISSFNYISDLLPNDRDENPDPKFIICRLSHQACINCLDPKPDQAKTGLVVIDSQGNFIPCSIAVGEISPSSIDKIVLLLSWTYIPLARPSKGRKTLKTKQEGYLEIDSLLILQSSRESLSLTTDGLPPATCISVTDAYDMKKSRLRSKCTAKNGIKTLPLVSIFGLVNRISPIEKLQNSSFYYLVELSSTENSKTLVTVFVELDTCLPPAICHHWAAYHDVLNIGLCIMLTNLKASRLSIDHTERVQCLRVTESSLLVPVISNVSVAAGSPRSLTPNHLQHNDRFLHCLEGQISSNFDGKRFGVQLEFVYVHRYHLTNPGYGLRIGCKVKVWNLHVIFQGNQQIGYGLCSSSRIEIIEHGLSTHTPYDPQTTINQNLQIPSECPFVIAHRMSWLESTARKMKFARMENAPPISYTDASLIVMGCPIATQDFKSPPLPLQEWFRHETRYGGCGTTEYQQIDKLLQFEYLTNNHPRLSNAEKKWNCSCWNPSLDLQLSSVHLIGIFSNRRLTNDKFPLELSNNNVLTFVSPFFSIPIVLIGSQTFHLDKLCKLSNFWVISEKTSSPSPEEVEQCEQGDWAPYERSEQVLHPYQLYLICSISDVQFVFPQTVQPSEQEHPSCRFTFQVLRKSLACWSKEQDSDSNTCESRHSSFQTEVLILIPEKEQAIKTVTFNAQPTNWYSTINQDLFYDGAFLAVGKDRIVTKADSTFQQRSVDSIAINLAKRNIVVPQETSITLNSIRECMWNNQAFKPAKEKNHPRFNFHALIVNRTQEPTVADPRWKNFRRVSNFVNSDELEYRSEFGQISLVVRDLEFPDELKLYFKPDKLVLPFGLIPGTIVFFKRVAIIISRTKCFGLIELANSPSLEIIGFDPSVYLNCGFSVPPSICKLTISPINITIDLPTPNTFSFSSQHRLINDIRNLEWGLVPPRSFSRLYNAVCDARCYATRIFVSKVFYFKMELLCRECNNIVRNGTCASVECRGAGTKFISAISCEIDDSTGRAKTTASSNDTFPLLGIGHEMKSLLCDALEKLGELRIESGQKSIGSHIIQSAGELIDLGYNLTAEELDAISMLFAKAASVESHQLSIIYKICNLDTFSPVTPTVIKSLDLDIHSDPRLLSAATLSTTHPRVDLLRAAPFSASVSSVAHQLNYLKSISPELFI